jgi:drug/metabolite transporter (DMT)-like permease
MGNRTVAALLLVVVAASWGAIPVIVRGDVPWQELVAARLWLGAITVVAILAVQRRLRLPGKHRGRIVVSGVLLAFHWSTFFLALDTTTVATTLAIVYLGPVVAAAVAPRVLGERVDPKVYVGLAIALVGVMAVVRPGGESAALGIGAAVASGISFAVLLLIAKPAAEDLGGLVVAAGELVVAAVVATPWAFEAAGSFRANWLDFVVLGALLTGLGDWIFWGAMKVLPVAAVGVLMYTEPASAAIWATLFLGESLDVLTWIGIGFVVSGGILAGAVATRPEEEIVVPAPL